MLAIRITDETMQVIRGAAIHDFHQTGRRQADGTWLIEISDDVAKRVPPPVAMESYHSRTSSTSTSNVSHPREGTHAAKIIQRAVPFAAPRLPCDGKGAR